MLHILPLALLALLPVNPPPGDAAIQPAPATGDPIVFTQTARNADQSICYKIRAFIFERNDGAAPKLVRETTCPRAKPRMERSKTPQPRMIPAN